MIEWSRTETGTAATREEVPGGATIEAVDGVPVMGVCKDCGRLIMEGKTHWTDERKDVMLCMECCCAYTEIEGKGR